MAAGTDNKLSSLGAEGLRQPVSTLAIGRLTAKAGAVAGSLALHGLVAGSVAVGIWGIPKFDSQEQPTFVVEILQTDSALTRADSNPEFETASAQETDSLAQSDLEAPPEASQKAPQAHRAVDSEETANPTSGDRSKTSPRDQAKLETAPPAPEKSFNRADEEKLIAATTDRANTSASKVERSLPKSVPENPQTAEATPAETKPSSADTRGNAASDKASAQGSHTKSEPAPTAQSPRNIEVAAAPAPSLDTPGAKQKAAQDSGRTEEQDRSAPTLGSSGPAEDINALEKFVSREREHDKDNSARAETGADQTSDDPDKRPDSAEPQEADDASSSDLKESDLKLLARLQRVQRKPAPVRSAQWKSPEITSALTELKSRLDPQNEILAAHVISRRPISRDPRGRIPNTEMGEMVKTVRRALRTCWGEGGAGLVNSQSVIKIEVTMLPDQRVLGGFIINIADANNPATLLRFSLGSGVKQVKSCNPFTLPSGRYHVWRN